MGKKSKRRGGDRSAASTSRGAATGTADVPEDLTAMTISNEAGAAGQSTAAGTTSAVAIGKTRALLPAPVWAHSFDYLPYEHVRSARLVCKLFGKEVPRHVETLSIFKSAEMDVPNARRYSKQKAAQDDAKIEEEARQDGVENKDDNADEDDSNSLSSI